jgi:hypothetical protein
MWVLVAEDVRPSKVDTPTVGTMTSGLCLGSGLALFSDLTVGGNLSARDSLIRILFAGMNQYVRGQELRTSVDRETSVATEMCTASDLTTTPKARAESSVGFHL